MWFFSVGGGTAGCVLANRLSADPTVKVALIEAGHEESAYHMTEIPLASVELQMTAADWAYQTVSQNYSSGSMNNQVCYNIAMVYSYSLLMPYSREVVVVSHPQSRTLAHPGIWGK